MRNLRALVVAALWALGCGTQAFAEPPQPAPGERSAVRREVRGVAQGGSIALSLGGVTVTATTRAGQSAAEVAAAVAQAINADPALAAAGVSAASSGVKLSASAALDALEVRDPGLSLVQPREVPLLPILAVSIVSPVMLVGVVVGLYRIANKPRRSA